MGETNEPIWKYVDGKFEDMQRAIDKAESAIHGNLADSKEDLREVKGRLNDLESVRDLAAGKADQEAVDRLTLISIVGLLLAVVSIVVRFI